jgi:chemotaxis protein methyltransferase CheR
MTPDSTNSSLDQRSFEAIADLAYRESGLRLVAEKTSMIQSRLRHRLRELGLNNFEKYVGFVCSDDGIEERRQMISALTTNVSHFFRESHHFDILVGKMIPARLDSVRRGGKLRIWSAGCSNGQEAFSIALSIAKHHPELLDLDTKILATDIDPKVVTFAKSGKYPQRLVSGVPADLLKKYFIQTSDGEEPSFEVCNELKSLVVFKELNLLANWPMKNTVDAIFCRNVVIYFDLETQNRLWPRFRRQLSSQGYLFLGHSERIADPEQAGFKSEGPTSYRPSTP